MPLRLAKPVVVRIQKQARRVLNRVPRLENTQFLSVHRAGTILVDLRAAASFVRGFIPGSYNLADLKWLNLLRKNIPLEQRLVYLITEPDTPRDLRRTFAKHQFEVAGRFHPGVLGEWKTADGALGVIEELDPELLAVRLAGWKTVVVDLRDAAAFQAAHTPEALNLSLDNFRASIAGLPHETALTVICETGSRSSLAASLLWNLNYRKLSILRGGFHRYLECGLPAIRR